MIMFKIISGIFSIFTRCNSVFLFETPVKIGQIIKTGIYCNINYVIRSCGKKFCCNFESVIVKILYKTHPHGFFKELHKIWFTIEAMTGNFFYGDIILKMFSNIRKNCFYFFKSFFANWLFSFRPQLDIRR